MAIDLVCDALVWRTTRFILRPLEDADGPGLLAHLGDPAVVAFMDIAPLVELAEALEIVAWARERRAADAGVRWSIRGLDDDALVGTCGFNLVQRQPAGRAEVAYDVARRCWGQRVMDEILPHLMSFAFEGLALGRVEAVVTEGNGPSCRLLERHGFTRESLRRDSGFWKGRCWDQLVYARLAPG